MRRNGSGTVMVRKPQARPVGLEPRGRLKTIWRVHDDSQDESNHSLLDYYNNKISIAVDPNDFAACRKRVLIENMARGSTGLTLASGHDSGQVERVSPSLTPRAP